MGAELKWLSLVLVAFSLTATAGPVWKKGAAIPVVTEGAACNPAADKVGVTSSNLILSCQSGVWRTSSGVIAQSQVSSKNAAIRAAALAGCAITLTGTTTVTSTIPNWSVLGGPCDTTTTVKESATGTFSLLVSSTGTAQIAKLACSYSGTYAPMGSSDVSTSASCGKSSAFFCSSVTSVASAAFSDELITGSTYRGKFTVGSAVAYCPNTYVLPAWEPAYLAQ